MKMETKQTNHDVLWVLAVLQDWLSEKYKINMVVSHPMRTLFSITTPYYPKIILDNYKYRYKLHIMPVAGLNNFLFWPSLHTKVLKLPTSLLMCLPLYFLMQQGEIGENFSEKSVNTSRLAMIMLGVRKNSPLRHGSSVGQFYLLTLWFYHSLCYELSAA